MMGLACDAIIGLAYDAGCCHDAAALFAATALCSALSNLMQIIELEQHIRLFKCVLSSQVLQACIPACLALRAAAARPAHQLMPPRVLSPRPRPEAQSTTTLTTVVVHLHRTSTVCCSWGSPGWAHPPRPAPQPEPRRPPMQRCNTAKHLQTTERYVHQQFRSRWRPQPTPTPTS